jgi:hypothetical protein
MSAHRHQVAGFLLHPLDDQQAYEQLEEDIRSAMKAHRGNKSGISI